MHEPDPSRAPAARPRRRLVWTVAGAVACAAAVGTAAVAVAARDGGSGAGRRAARPEAAGTRAAPRTPASPSRSRSPRPRPDGRRQPERVRVPVAGTGRFTTAPAAASTAYRTAGAARTVRYAVDVEGGLPFDAAVFAAQVQRILNDPRSWGHGGRARFVRVAGGPVAFRVSLASPSLTDRLCAPLITGGELSCRSGTRSVINARRWGQGAVTYGADLASYREYVVNHEVGHALGHGHEQCPGRGRRAPVMVQQTKSLQGCRINPWPFPG
ncbi:hypothetical protein BTM25_55660 [Actinomadura rubteroloni]|uniref:DUF3152 domain-containing protein n=1 Tax=Actinomadura rubteroloni TaxID=1926885 RepID=A0A2P4UC51_9ACTN|nr:DUF3152 domain-containing protein [Actinomadura rubteroloni]POM22616.1 hypothetical protein BTM25_55660 [Actinomadura rubteroloni]